MIARLKAAATRSTRAVRAWAATRSVLCRLSLGKGVDREALDALVERLGRRGAGLGRAARLDLAAVHAGLLDAEALVAPLTRLGVLPETCLYRALARFHVLSLGGHEPRFLLGIQSGARELEGHAWLELDGAVFDEDLEPGIVVTYAFPPRRANGDAA